MHRDFFERFVEGRSGRLLDMGSGLGFFLKAMARYKEWEAYGCEISPAAVRFAREQLGLDKVQCARLQDADLPRDSFDIIVMWDVLDHMARPDPLLARCRTLLKEDGILFIRTPNVAAQLLRARVVKALGGIRAGMKCLQPSDHPHHYSMRSLTALLRRNGFTGVSFIHLHPVGSESGTRWRATLTTLVKTMTYQMVRTLAVCTGGRQNLDNLFVIARKSAVLPPT
jgi:SAM-dependent methyltransferase